MKTKQRRLSHQEKTSLFEMYETGKYTAVDLSKIFPISNVAISGLLKRHGYKSKSQSELQRKYPVQEDFFDTIDTQEKAYVLGLLYADGYNDIDKNAVALGLKEDDKEILDKITKIIQPTKPLQFVHVSKKKKTKGFENSQDQYRLAIANKHISEKLVELGCGKAKTHTLKFPTEEQVPKYLQRHFIRGYFDGDGSVSGDKQKQFSIIGTIDFLIPLQETLIEELGFSKTKLDDRHKERKNNIRSLRYCGINQCMTFRDWLYKDATIFMGRKKNIFDSYKKRYGNGQHP